VVIVLVLWGSMPIVCCQIRNLMSVTTPHTSACSHNHAHDHDHAAVSAAKMGWAVGLTLAFVAVEAVAGWFSHSLALVGDAGHNFADAAALGFSWYALWIARKPSHAGMTFGYHRVGILAALVNAASLVGIALGIGWEAVERLRHPAPAAGWAMVAVAAVAVALNFTIGSWLHAGSHHDLNVRSARLHMLGDAVSAIGVVVAGLVVALTHWSVADPIVSLLIAALILISSWGVLRESVNVLLEATPAGTDMTAVERDLAAVDGVVGTHDLHVWTVGPGVVAASVHVRVGCDGRDRQVLRSVVAELRRHGINHTTVQVDQDCCGDDADLYCRMEPAASHIGHGH
jgi:cobalt-zinc-cadmium efflux system protein